MKDDELQDLLASISDPAARRALIDAAQACAEICEEIAFPPTSTGPTAASGFESKAPGASQLQAARTLRTIRHHLSKCVEAASIYERRQGSAVYGQPRSVPGRPPRVALTQATIDLFRATPGTITHKINVVGWTPRYFYKAVARGEQQTAGPERDLFQAYKEVRSEK